MASPTSTVKVVEDYQSHALPLDSSVPSFSSLSGKLWNAFFFLLTVVVVVVVVDLFIYFSVFFFFFWGSADSSHGGLAITKEVDGCVEEAKKKKKKKKNLKRRNETTIGILTITVRSGLVRVQWPPNFKKKNSCS